MKNVVFDLGGVVVDWSPERLMEEYTGDRAMPVSLFERGVFPEILARLRPGTIDQVNIVREMSVFRDVLMPNVGILSNLSNIRCGIFPKHNV